jgi:hypothetical protein
VRTTLYRPFRVTEEHAATPATTPNGATPNARTQTAYTYRTPLGNSKRTTTTHRGEPCPAKLRRPEQRLPSSHPIGPTDRSSNSYTTWPPNHPLSRYTRPFISRTARLAHGFGRPWWSGVAFRLPLRRGHTRAEAQYDTFYGQQAQESLTYTFSPTTHRYDHGQPATRISSNPTPTRRGHLP